MIISKEADMPNSDKYVPYVKKLHQAIHGDIARFIKEQRADLNDEDVLNVIGSALTTAIVNFIINSINFVRDELRSEAFEFTEKDRKEMVEGFLSNVLKQTEIMLNVKNKTH